MLETRYCMIVPRSVQSTQQPMIYVQYISTHVQVHKGTIGSQGLKRYMYRSHCTHCTCPLAECHQHHLMKKMCITQLVCVGLASPVNSDVCFSFLSSLPLFIIGSLLYLQQVRWSLIHSYETYISRPLKH